MVFKSTSLVCTTSTNLPVTPSTIFVTVLIAQVSNEKREAVQSPLVSLSMGNLISRFCELVLMLFNAMSTGPVSSS